MPVQKVRLSSSYHVPVDSYSDDGVHKDLDTQHSVSYGPMVSSHEATAIAETLVGVFDDVVVQKRPPCASSIRFGISPVQVALLRRSYADMAGAGKEVGELAGEACVSSSFEEARLTAVQL